MVLVFRVQGLGCGVYDEGEVLLRSASYLSGVLGVGVSEHLVLARHRPQVHAQHPHLAAGDLRA